MRTILRIKRKLKKYVIKYPMIQRIVYNIVLFVLGIIDYILYGFYDPREFNICDEKKIVYLNNAKVACSSIKTAIFTVPVLDDYGIHTITEQYRSRKLTPKEKQYFKFTFVRNPFERLVSCYESKYYTDKIKYQKKVLYFEYYLLGRLKKDKGFDNFVAEVCKIPNSFADKHFCSQYNLVYDTKRGKEICLLDFVGKYENIQQDFETIQKRFGLKQLPHYNKSAKKNWMDYYTLKTANMVYKRYEKDIKVFGYNDLYQELISYLKEKDSK